MDHTLGRRLFSAAFIGLPYALFKIGGGLAAAADVDVAVGALFIAWGGADLLLNFAALVWPRRVGYCVLSTLGRRVGAERQLLAVDAFLSGAIIATMILLGRSGRLPAPAPLIWQLAVVGHILGVGVDRLRTAWREGAR
jgi:hypothetical protein